MTMIGKSDRTLGTPIAQPIVHPSYDSTNAYYDVALLRLAKPVYLTTPATVTTTAQASYYLKPNRAARIAGRGITPL
jgi:hypothetical protein